jgi:hypothetical protein
MAIEMLYSFECHRNPNEPNFRKAQPLQRSYEQMMPPGQEEGQVVVDPA